MAFLDGQNKTLHACFIGANVMGPALADTLVKSGAFLEENIVFTDTSTENLAKMKTKFPKAAVTSDSKQSIKNAEIIFLCVKPHVLIKTVS